MAYVRKDKVFRLRFDDGHQFAGLDLSTRSVSIRELSTMGLGLDKSREALSHGTDSEKLSALGGFCDTLDELRVSFAGYLISWNMEEEDGTPTPADLDGVNRLDDTEFLDLVGFWMTAIGGVSEEEGKGSGSGETSPELSALMEPLSPSQAS